MKKIYQHSLLLVICAFFCSMEVFAAAELSADYETLKPFHVQQDRRDGCSLAASFMLFNALLKMVHSPNSFLTQTQLRQWLGKFPGLLKQWEGRVSGKGLGVSFTQLAQYLPQALQQMGLVTTVTKQMRRNTSFATFTQDMLLAENNPNVILLLNYRGHWSPLGHYDPQTQKMLILDVDYDQNYKEYYYKEGQGEYKTNARQFFNKWSSYRGYLKVVLAP